MQLSTDLTHTIAPDHTRPDPWMDATWSNSLCLRIFSFPRHSEGKLVTKSVRLCWLHVFYRLRGDRLFAGHRREADEKLVIAKPSNR